MEFKIEMSRNWEGDVGRMAQREVERSAADHQKVIDRLARQCKGPPVSESKPVLRRKWSQLDVAISDRVVADYAQRILEGQRIRVQVDK